MCNLLGRYLVKVHTKMAPMVTFVCTTIYASGSFFRPGHSCPAASNAPDRIVSASACPGNLADAGFAQMLPEHGKRFLDSAAREAEIDHPGPSPLIPLAGVQQEIRVLHKALFGIGRQVRPDEKTSGGR